jgi:hypothetical protein
MHQIHQSIETEIFADDMLQVQQQLQHVQHCSSIRLLVKVMVMTLIILVIYAKTKRRGG